MYQYGGGGLSAALTEMYRGASQPMGRGLNNYSASQVAQYETLQQSLPYLKALEEMRVRDEDKQADYDHAYELQRRNARKDLEMQRRDALADQYGARQKYYFEYGI